LRGTNLNLNQLLGKEILKKNEGGGEYRILSNGKIFEKVGVNYSKSIWKIS
tara:strand:+ start:492 stop:644 length:153 start_codon:yes stop_codon:yes gene_type:complete